MAPLLLTIALFAGWFLVGYAVLAAVRADLGSLRICLTAPALGTVVVVLVTFGTAQLGASVGDTALPIAVALAVGVVAVLVWRRPPLPDLLGLAPVLAACGLALAVICGPMLDFGFAWLANVNDDMVNYTIGATRLLERGYSAPLDVGLLASGRDYTEAYMGLFGSGVRPGSETLLAWVSEVVGRRPIEIFMPTIVALHLAGICATAALALQATSRRWAAGVAAFVVALAPMAVYGVVQQLIAQVFGLALAAALAALLMRRDLYREGWAKAGEFVPIGLLVAGLAMVYPEAGSILGVGYFVWLGLGLLSRRLVLRALPRAVLPVAAVAVVALGPYLLRVTAFLLNQAGNGASSSDSGALSLFNFMLVPTALPGATGLQTLVPPPLGAPNLDLSIAVAALVLVALACVFVAGLRRGGAAATIGVVMLVVATFLGMRGADFGLFKLTMFAVPFAAAAFAAWMAIGGRWRIVVGGAPLIALAFAWLATQSNYVEASRQPIELPNASAKGHLTAMRDDLDGADRGAIVSAVDNIVLEKLQALAARGRKLDFIAQNFAGALLSQPNLDDENARRVDRLLEVDGWDDEEFPIGGGIAPNTFLGSHAATKSLRSPGCELILPGAAQSVFNRSGAAVGSGNYRFGACSEFDDVLVFVKSRLGHHYYLGDRQRVSHYQLEHDPYTGGSFSAFGRYALFRVINPTPGARLEVDLTSTLAGDRRNELPPVSVIGANRVRLPLVGRGSARVYSPPVRPLTIDGASYLMVDMGRPGTTPDTTLDGLGGLYGKGTPIDNRQLTARVRNLSLLPAADIRDRRPPRALDGFPAALADPALEYSGIYEDGWIGESAFAVLAGRDGDHLRVSGVVAPGIRHQRLEVFVDGRRVARTRLSAGEFEVVARAPGGVARERRRVELRFAHERALPAPDNRPAAAQLTFVGFGVGR